jgi:uncharacterized protein YcbK (DUF882 family)
MKKVLFMLVLAVTFVVPAVADEETRIIAFYHTHSGKSLSVKYKVDGEFQQEALLQLREFLADWRDGEQFDIDPALLDALYQIREAAGSTGTFEVISAYRSPATNKMLRSKSNGVARNSQHLLGKAIDVRLSDLDTKTLHTTALALGLGGVGYYGKSDFVHIDTGRVRRW